MLEFDDDVVTSLFAMEVTREVVPLAAGEEPHAEIPISKKGNNRRKRTL